MILPADPAAGRDTWVQPNALKMDFILRADSGEAAAALRFPSFLGLRALAGRGEKHWVFDQAASSPTKMIVREPEGGREIAVLADYQRTGNGILEQADGGRYRIHVDSWKETLEIGTDAGNPLVRFHPKGWLHLSAVVERFSLADGPAEPAWLVPFGWYLTILMRSPGEYGFRRLTGLLGLGK